MLGRFLLTDSRLKLLVYGLCGSERVVSVANCEEQGRERGVTVALLHSLGGDKRVKRVGYGCLSALAKKSSRDMTAAEHKIGVISELRAAFCREGLDDRALGVVYQKHNVRKLDLRVTSYRYSRGNALDNRRLCCSDERVGALSEIVTLKIDRHNDAAAQTSVRLHSLDVYHGVGMLAENISHIDLHSGVYGRNTLLGLAKIDLGENYAERRGRVAHSLVGALPVVRFARELVAGDHRPLFCRDVIEIGEQYICTCKCFFHNIISFSFRVLCSQIWRRVLAFCKARTVFLF